jgi:transcription initiation factor TFIIB
MARSTIPTLYDGDAPDSTSTTDTEPVPGPPTRCPECRSELTHHAHEAVCSDCGLVADTDQLDRGPEWREFDDGTGTTMRRCNDGGMVDTHHDKGLGTTISHTAGNRRDLSRLRTWNSRARFGAGDRNQAHANGAIKRIASRLDLPSSLTARACRLYKHAQEADLVMGRSIEQVVGGAVYAACREMELGRLPDEVAREIRLTESDLTGRTTPTEAIQSMYSLLCRELGLTPKPPVPSDYIQRIISGLDVSPAASLVAGEIATAADNHTELAGRSPSGVAAACVYLASKVTGAKIPQREVADQVGVTPVTVRASARTLEEMDRTKNILLTHGLIPETASTRPPAPPTAAAGVAAD